MVVPCRKNADIAHSRGGYHEYRGGYLEYCGGVQYRGGYHDKSEGYSEYPHGTAHTLYRVVI